MTQTFHSQPITIAGQPGHNQNI